LGRDDQIIQRRKGVVVIGGGIAGIQASLDLADTGIKVYLVEKSPSIGGRMAQLDKTFPTNDCSMCILAPKMVTAGRHPNIEILTNSVITEVKGAKGDFQVKIKKHARFVDEDKCVGCGMCVNKCPSKVTNNFDLGLSNRKAIYIPFPQAVPLKYSIDEEHCKYLTKGKCGLCKEVCPADAINFEDMDRTVEVNAGAIIVATGFGQMNPFNIHRYGFGRHKNVITSMQFERLLNASGPTGGFVVRPSDGKGPQRIAFIQCVGSRDVNECNYCSRVCCMYSVKQAMVAKEHEASIEDILIFFTDVRTYGKGFDEFYERSQKAKVNFIRGYPAEILEDENNDLIIRFENTIHFENAVTEEVYDVGDVNELKADLVVLATPIIPSEDTKKVSEILDIELDENGFLKEKHINAKSTDSSREGIFLAGCAQGPKDIPDSVAQASAAAAKAAALMSDYRMIDDRKKVPQNNFGSIPRIGVFVCHCGVNIGAVVDVNGVVNYAKSLPNVEFVEDNLYSCSDETQQRIHDAIKKYKLNRLVVAACTPRTHEPLFRETCEKAGLNPYLFEMTNIRDQCSWVHMKEPEEATAKAKDLVRMAVMRARLHEPLKSNEVKVGKSSLVIGGGIAGIQAAMDLANQGFDVTIVEKKPYIGGMAARIGKLPPENKDINEILKEQYMKLEEKNVNILTNAKIVDVNGFVGNFEVDISQQERGVDIEKCNSCGDCLKVCPVDVKYGYSSWVPPRKAIYFKYNTYPMSYTIDFEACTKCGECIKACKQNAVKLNNKENINIRLNVSTIVIAVGAALYDPTGEYGYGEYPNVVTNMDVERELSFRDVNELTINNSKLKNVVYILCVGSRDPDNPKGNPGCSRYCCQNAIKQAIRLRGRGVNVWIIFRDIRTFSKGTEEMYYEASKMGVKFINSYRKDKKPKVFDDGKKVEVFDELTGETLVLDADAVVLSVGMVPNEIEVEELQKMLKIPRSGDGFFMEKHPKLGPVETNTEGIYLCGCAQSPKDIADTIAQASAAAAKAAIPMARGKIETEPIIAWIDEHLCGGCGLCKEACQFNAIELTEKDKGVFVARINDVLCKGCGTCVALCPSKAISQRGFTDEQLIIQIDEATTPLSSENGPNIVGFCCNWCSYAGADMAGVSRFQYPPNIRIIRTMCSGRIDPILIIKAILNGADGVFVSGCHPGECHYITGNNYTRERIHQLKEMLSAYGIDPRRLRLEWISASEGNRFAELVTEFTEEVKNLGPNHLRNNQCGRGIGVAET